MVHKNTTHGMVYSVEYTTWRNMKSRCMNPHREDYKWYGAIGVTVHPAWIHSFKKFLSDVGRKPSPKHTLERIDTKLGYVPGNVRWATQKEQQRNRRNNRLVTINGKTKCLTEWCEVFGIGKYVVNLRLRRGWSELRSLTTPLIKRA